MSGITSPIGGLVITHHVHVDPTRSMKSVTGDVQALLEEYGDEPRRSCALLASELIAQIVGRERNWEGGPVELTIQLREELIRLEATGPASVGVDHNDAAAPLAQWGEFLLDRLSDRWGVRGGPDRAIWAEVQV
jgi:hypothetical protein